MIPASSANRDGAAADPASRRRFVLAILFAAGLVNYLDRSSLAVAAPLIGRDLGIGTARMGVVLGVFQAAYGLAQIPTSLVVRRLGSRASLSVAMIAWSTVQAACGAAGGLTSLATLRAALGVAEAPLLPLSATVVARWFEASRRGFATAVYTAASPIGGAIAPLAITGLMLAMGWRAMFAALGCAGVAIGLSWLAVYRDPPVNEAARPSTGRSFDLPRLTSLARMPRVWAMMLAYCGPSYLSWLLVAWVPGFLTIERHLTVAETGFAAAVPFVAGALGASSAWVGDVLIVRGVERVLARKLPIVAALLLAAACLCFTAITTDTVSAVAGLSCCAFLAFFALSCVWVLVVEMAEAADVAALGGLVNTMTAVAGFLAPVLTGMIVQKTGAFSAAFALAAAIAATSAVIWWFAAAGRIPDFASRVSQRRLGSVRQRRHPHPASRSGDLRRPD